MSYVKQDEGGGGDTYTLRAAQSGADVDIQLDAATGSDSDVKLKAGTNITLTSTRRAVALRVGRTPKSSSMTVAHSVVMQTSRSRKPQGRSRSRYPPHHQRNF